MTTQVKQLEWSENGRSGNSYWTGELAFGVYYTIHAEGHLWRTERRQLLSDAEKHVGSFPTLTAAKAGAQSDYDAEVRAALSEEH